jgi:lysophospholipase L1-like esterase
MRFLSNITILIAALATTTACGGKTPIQPPPPPPPPVEIQLTCPAAIVREATSPQGTDVHFDPLTPTTGTPPFNVQCDPGSGSIFSIGETKVRCTATGADMAQASCEFAVTVRVSRWLSKIHFVAFGDSITEGQVSPAATFTLVEPLESYPYKLEQMLESRYPASDIVVDNEGLGGEDPRGGVVRLPGVLQARQPEVLLLQEGTNGLTPDRVSQWASHLRTMVSTARGANVDVIIANILPVFPPHVNASRQTKPAAVVQLNGRIKSIADEFGIAPVVDLYSEFAAHPQFIGADGLHPTREGYTRMAELFAVEIARRYGVDNQTLLSRAR